MNISVRELDLESDSELERYDVLDRACDQDIYGAIEVRSIEQLRARLRSSPHRNVQHWVAEVAGEMVGYAVAYFPLSENLDQVSVDVYAHPQWRGQGVATRLIEDAVRPAVQESGRRLITAYGTVPSEGDVDGAMLPTNRLAARYGLARKNVAVCRILSLPLAESLLDELTAQAAAKIGDYRVLMFDDVIPTEHLQAYGQLLYQLELDDPDEDVEYEPPDYTPERIRAAEQRRRDSGRRSMIAVAVAPDGSFAGNSVVDFQIGEGTTLGWQENTLVMPAHRGHRLGLALKVATHRRLAQEAPGLRAIVTWNSHVNPWMIAINEQLGYQVSHREIVYQGRPLG